MHTRLSTPLRPLALSHIAKRTHSFTLLEPLLNNMSLPRESAVREECWIDTASVPRCTKHMLYRTVSYWVVLHCLVPQWCTGKIGKAFESNYRWRQCNYKTECRILIISYHYLSEFALLEIRGLSWTAFYVGPLWHFFSLVKLFKLDFVSCPSCFLCFVIPQPPKSTEKPRDGLSVLTVHVLKWLRPDRTVGARKACFPDFCV
jgi:hypothetical protein